MTTYSANLTNSTVLLPQSRDSCHHVSSTSCPRRSTHLSLLLREHSRTQLVPRKRPGDLRLLRRLPIRHSRRNGSARTLAPPHLHRSECRNTLIYGHTTSHTLPTCDTSLGSVTAEAGDFVELLEPYLHILELRWIYRAPHNVIKRSSLLRQIQNAGSIEYESDRAHISVAVLADNMMVFIFTSFQAVPEERLSSL